MPTTIRLVQAAARDTGYFVRFNDKTAKLFPSSAEVQNETSVAACEAELVDALKRVLTRYRIRDGAGVVGTGFLIDMAAADGNVVKRVL